MPLTIAKAPYVTALPAGPYDGQEVYYGADPTNGIIWHLRYRAAASGSYKWEVVGGSPLEATVDTAENTASTSYADLATAGPSVTAPLAGDYEIMHGCGALNTTAATQNIMSYAIGGTGASDNDCLNNRGATASGGFIQEAQNLRVNVKTAVAAGTAFVSKYKVSAGTGTFERRVMRIMPRRVG